MVETWRSESFRKEARPAQLIGDCLLRQKITSKSKTPKRLMKSPAILASCRDILSRQRQYHQGRMTSTCSTMTTVVSLKSIEQVLEMRRQTKARKPTSH